MGLFEIPRTVDRVLRHPITRMPERDPKEADIRKIATALAAQNGAEAEDSDRFLEMSKALVRLSRKWYD